MSQHISNTLSDTISLGKAGLSNRIIMAPMTRCRAIGNIPNGLMADYYGQRSSAGLLITEGTAPAINGLGYARIPGIYSQEQIEGWKKTTDMVHANAGKIFMQLMHVGRIAHSANMPEGARIVAPSAISANGDMWTDSLGMQKTEVPVAMDAATIVQTKNEFVQAAKNAVEAGFDGIELHAANGYLLEQFLNPHSNTRTDAYGGSVENRCRFLLEVAKETGEAIGFDKTAVRISPFGTYNTMPAYNETTETYHYLVTELNKLGIVYLHMIDYAARNTAEGPALLQSIRKIFKQLLILNGGYTKDRAEKTIANEEADLISFGASFIANPDLPYRIGHNIEWSKPDAETFYTADAKGYTDYAVYNELAL